MKLSNKKEQTTFGDNIFTRSKTNMFWLAKKLEKLLIKYQQKFEQSCLEYKPVKKKCLLSLHCFS